MPDIYKYPPATQSVTWETGKNEGMDVERIEINSGIRIYLKGEVHPSKGLPTPEAIVAVNSVKRWAKLLLRLKIAPGAFWSESVLVMRPYILKPEYQQIFTKELTNLLEHFVSREKAETIAHIFEYDRAYRFRVQDLFDCTWQRRILEGPIHEIGRLIKINGVRDYAAVHTKIRAFGRLRWLLLWPPLRKRFVTAIRSCHYVDLIPDDDDIYWMSKQDDYRYGQK